MKKAFMFLSLAAATLQAGEWVWTFQWAGSTRGIYFEDTSLTPAAKAAIRDDTAHILSYSPGSNAVFSAMPPADPCFGQHTGVAALGLNVRPAQFRCQYYKQHTGTPYLFFPTGMTSNYLSHIAMTNQQAAAYSSLSNFVHSINHISTNTVSSNTFASLFWTLSRNRVATAQDFTEQGGAYPFIINDISKYEFAFQSILEFGAKAVDDGPFIWCSLIFHPKEDAYDSDVWTRWPAIYKDGVWRLIATYEL